MIPDMIKKEKKYNTYFVVYKGKEYGYFGTKLGAKEWLKDRKKEEEESKNSA